MKIKFLSYKVNEKMEYSNTGGMRSPFSPRVRTSIAGRRPIGLNSAKKNQGKFIHGEQQFGDVIYKTPSMTIETYGAPLPVLVTETLAFASGDVSVRMSSCGWCWVVAGRRVLAWPRETSTPGVPTAARELTLPQTDLAHKADLVELFYEDGAQMPSCVGVSPEGVVRYWASVGVEGAYSDVACELAGQECERLVRHERLPHLLLATTTCTLLTVTTCREGRSSPRCQVVRPAGGWLGGIGRRVSHLFFGSMPAHTDTKLVGVVVLEGNGGMCDDDGAADDDEPTVALVAGGPLLQLWRGARVAEHPLRRALAEGVARAHLLQGDLNSLEILALDVHAHGPNGLLLLVAAVNVARSPEMRHALAHVCLEAGGARVASLLPLRAPRDDEPPRCLPLPSAPLLYTSAGVLLCSPGGANAGAGAVTGGAGGAEAEAVDVRADADRLLGAALVAGAPLLFSRKHGVLLLRAEPPRARSICDSPMDSPCPSDMYDGNLTFYEIDPHEVSGMMTDACGRLKTAFLFHVRRDPAAGRVLAELFPARADDIDVDAALDRTVLAVADELLDDVPAGDPRWKSSGNASRVALGSSAALAAGAQLRDKQRALSLLLDMLRAHALWPRLGRVTREDGEGTESTAWALCQRGAWLAGARALQRLAGAAPVAAALAARAPDLQEDGQGALPAADVCWCRAAQLPRLLLSLARQPTPAEPRAAAAHAHQAVTALTSVLTEMQKWCAQWEQWAGPALRSPPAMGPDALVPALAQLHTRTVTQVCGRCPEGGLRGQLLEACATLAELLLLEAEPLRDEPAYRRLRRDLLRPYVVEGQTERAAALAEKFRDFELLVELCVRRADMERLNDYIDKYAAEGMAETAFATLCSGAPAQRAQLLRALGGRQRARLSAWLARAPGRRPLRALLALSQLERERAPAAAASVLAELAAEETASLQRMTTMASLAKLCALASERGEAAEAQQAAEGRLALAEQHAALPRELRLHHGLPEGDWRVFEPEELVQMYVQCSGRSLTEYDYKKALDLTDCVPDMEARDELRLRVWCACILRDEWPGPGAAPELQLQQKTFSRLVDLVQLMGGDLELLLPPLEDVQTARELAELVSSPPAHFLLKYCYECLERRDH